MRLFVFMIFLSMINANLFPGGGSCDAVKITGRVQIYGSEPHTFVGIIDENGNEFAIYPESQGEALRELQGHLIEFSVIFINEPRGYGALFLRGGTVTVLEWAIIR
ncbi:MAG: hypothetical protein FWE09_04275 [Treponema sp.]|nr:hypothetical protein [Treponema sp.]